MRGSRTPWLLSATLAALALGALPPAARSGQDEEDRDDDDAPASEPYLLHRRMMDFEALSVEGEMGVTPGGAQDIGYARQEILDGRIPHPNVFTPEGLFSEHDLPLAPGAPCEELICVDGETAAGSLIVQQDVRWLSQLGFRSGLDPATWRRDPLNLVAVVDTSCSMSGAPIETVRETLRGVAGHLGPDDRLSIVRYSEAVEVVLQGTSATQRDTVRAGIGKLVIGGSTNMEAGLQLGFATARSSAPDFDGTTRVMLFTDERPNVGATDADSFMGLARAAGEQGIGLTTVGVSTHFGAELATAVSSVRGGNLVFFPDVSTMKDVFDEDFDTLVTELAYDLDLSVRPAPGVKVAGVYGIPGEALRWGEDGAIDLHVSTLFLSRRKGAIFVAFASDTKMGLPETRPRPGARVAEVKLGYTLRDGSRVDGGVALQQGRTARASVGLERGRLLVQEVTALKEATSAHHERNDQEGAYQAVHALASLMRQSGDDTLAGEREMVFALERTLAELAGYAGEPEALGRRNQVTGLPPMD